MIVTICFLLMLNFCGNLGHHGDEKPNKKFEPRIIGGQIAANRKFFLPKHLFKDEFDPQSEAIMFNVVIKIGWIIFMMKK